MAFWTNIYPFRDSPDKPVRVLFFPVANDAPFVPFPTPNILRFWDKLDQLEEPIYGTKYDRIQYELGPLPVNQPGTPCGTADQWDGDIDYATWLAGGYACGCSGPILATYVIDVYSPTTSLIVNPHNGHVLVDVNEAYQNQWLVIQKFGQGLEVTNGQIVLDNATTPPRYNVITHQQFVIDASVGSAEYLNLSSYRDVATGNLTTMGVTEIPNMAPTAPGPHVWQFGANNPGAIRATALATQAAGGAVRQGVGGSIPALFELEGGIIWQMHALPGVATKYLDGTGNFSTPAGGGGGMAIGGAVAGGTAERVLFIAAGPVLAQSAAFNFDTAGTGPLGAPKTLYLGDPADAVNPGFIGFWCPDNSTWAALVGVGGNVTGTIVPSWPVNNITGDTGSEASVLSVTYPYDTQVTVTVSLIVNSAGGSVKASVAWTDPASNSHTLDMASAGVTPTVLQTTVGPKVYQVFTVPVKGGTTVTISTTVVGTINYDVYAALTQMF